MLKRTARCALLSALLASTSFSSLEIANDLAAKNVMPFREGHLFVKVNDLASDDALERTASVLGATAVKSYTLVPGLELYEFDESIDMEEAIATFLSNDYVEYVEPDYFYSAAIQNDPRYAEQWSLENIGQTGGTADADINATQMWAIEDGSPAVVVGVIDTGVDYNHADLRENMWRNPSEIPGNGIDDDNNGYIDDVYGINAINGSGNPVDDNAHGTHVAGTIGADGNNAVGVVGVAQDVQIAGCKFLAANGSGSTSDAIECLQYFAALKSRAVNPVNIVATNNSWGGSSRSQALEDAIKAHKNLGILFVAAAGNSAANNDTSGSYPANYDVPNVISVAATDHNDRLASFSSYGKRSVHVAAPGVKILSTVLNQGYSAFSGTSMATPHVTGLVAVTKSRFPELDYLQLKNLVIASGTPIASISNTTITGRRIRGADNNGTGSLTCSSQFVNSRIKPASNNISILKGQSVFLSTLRLNCSQPAGPILLYNDANENVLLEDNGVNGDVQAGDGVYSLLWTPKNGGNFGLNFGNGDVVTVSVTQTPPTYKAYSVNFEYETIVGTSLRATDESVHNVTVPFPIHFNDDPNGFQTIYVTANGTISFTNGTNPGYVNRSLPSSIAATLVVPYWDDLIPSGQNSNVYVATLGSAPNRRFIVEWRNLRHYNVAGTGTFQAIFYENSPDVRYNYLDTNFSNALYSYGRSATVGVQNSTSSATLFSFNAANVRSSSSLLFRLE